MNNHFKSGFAGSLAAFFVQQFFLLFFVLGQTMRSWFLLTIILIPTALIIGIFVGKYGHKLSGIDNRFNTFALGFLVKFFAIFLSTWVDVNLLGQPVTADATNSYRIYLISLEIICGLSLFMAIGWLERISAKIITR